MSLLADLLSKTKNVKLPNDKGVPPTLARAQRATDAASPKLRKHFTIMSMIAVAAILIGIFLPSQLKRLSPLLATKAAVIPPQPMKVPLPSRTSPANAPEQIVDDAQRLLAAAQQAKIAPSAGSEKPAVDPELVKTPAPAQAGQSTQSTQSTTSAASGTSTKKRPAPGGKKTASRPHMAKAPPKKLTRPQEKVVSVKPVIPVQKPVEATKSKIDTNARGALLYAARSAEQAGDWRGALASYRAALDIDPDNHRILSNSAAAFNKLGMYADGERMARRALARKPDYIPALINAAIACSSQGNNREALRFFNSASAAEPGNLSLAINLGVMQERTGNADEALKTYRRVAASGDPQALLGIGRIHDQKGNKLEAITAYRLIMAQKNVDPALKREVKNRLVRLEE